MFMLFFGSASACLGHSVMKSRQNEEKKKSCIVLCIKVRAHTHNHMRDGYLFYMQAHAHIQVLTHTHTLPEICILHIFRKHTNVQDIPSLTATLEHFNH